MDAHVYRLKFSGGLHTGRRGVGLEATDHRLASDTIFAALLTQLAERHPALADELVSAFPRRTGADGTTYKAGDAPFLISSAFPFAGDVLLFPMPAISRVSAPSADKTLKKVRYVSQAIFRAVLNGATLADFGTKARSYQHGTVWIATGDEPGLPGELHPHEENIDIWRVRQRPRVAVDRESWRSAIFHHGETVFRQGCGLWFAIAWRDPDKRVGGYSLRDLVDSLLQDLQAFGIGGLRSCGLGAFEFGDPLVLNLPDPSPHDTVVTLSRFYPAPDELHYLDHPQASYRLTQISGWMRAAGVPDRERRTVTMIEEGAILTSGPKGGGCLVDISPDGAPHPSWRYGLMFPVGLAGGN